jgi:hypothetical protein
MVMGEDIDTIRIVDDDQARREGLLSLLKDKWQLRPAIPGSPGPGNRCRIRQLRRLDV